jgi:hypothetical protein
LVIYPVILKPASETLHFGLQGTCGREGVEVVAEGDAEVSLLLRVETIPRA